LLCALQAAVDRLEGIRRCVLRLTRQRLDLVGEISRSELLQLLEESASPGDEVRLGSSWLEAALRVVGSRAQVERLPISEGRVELGSA
jgi:hypothetical protein